MSARSIVLVTGGRDYRDIDRVCAVLDEVAPGLLIEGGADGADSLARGWARTKGVHVLRCDAQWFARGKGAGPARNAVMVEVCRRLGGMVVAFPGGKGTADCVAKARTAGLEVREVE